MGNDARAVKEMEYVFTVSSGYHNTTVQVTERCAFKAGIKSFFVILCINLIIKFWEEKNLQKMELFKLFLKSLQKVFIKPCRRNILKCSLLS